MLLVLAVILFLFSLYWELGIIQDIYWQRRINWLMERDKNWFEKEKWKYYNWFRRKNR